MEAQNLDYVEITIDGHLIKTFSLNELERELYERNMTFEEFYQTVVNDYKHRYENIDYASTMYFNTRWTYR